MLYFVTVSSTLHDAAKEVVTQVLEKYTSSVSKSARKLEDDVMAFGSKVFESAELLIESQFSIHAV